MNPRSPKYIQDLYKYIESIPFGELDIRIKRIDRKTVQLSTLSEETLRYVDNTEAIKDLVGMVQRLVEAGFSGEAHIKLDMNDGNIKLIGIFDKKNIKY